LVELVYRDKKRRTSLEMQRKPSRIRKGKLLWNSYVIFGKRLRKVSRMWPQYFYLCLSLSSMALAQLATDCQVTANIIIQDLYSTMEFEDTEALGGARLRQVE